MSSTSAPPWMLFNTRSLRADALGPLAHAGKAPMPFAAGLEDVLVYGRSHRRGRKGKDDWRHRLVRRRWRSRRRAGTR